MGKGLEERFRELPPALAPGRAGVGIHAATPGPPSHALLENWGLREPELTPCAHAALASPVFMLPCVVSKFNPFLFTEIFYSIA